MEPSGPRGSFVGRVDEMQRLRQALAATRAGRPAVEVVSGESGVGKTRLVNEFATEARSHDATVIVGSCADYGENGPSYWAFLEALRPVWGRAGFAEPVCQIIDAAPATLPGAAEPAATRSAPIFELVLRVLRTLADTSPLVLILEDIHWADRSTQALLTFLLANLSHDRVLIVLTYRSESLSRRHPLQPLLAELRRGRRAEFLPLRPFTRSEMAAQLEGLLGRPPGKGLVELTWTRSDGNAFFAEELVAAMAEGYGHDLPPTLQHILMCRLDAVSDQTNGVLRLVAVATDGVSFPVLAEVATLARSKHAGSTQVGSNLDEADLVGCLREAVEHDLLQVARDGQIYLLRHSLLQEVLYDDLLPGERQLLHATYAEALTRTHPRPNLPVLVKVARHWHAAGNSDRALPATLAAAVAAAAIFGFAEAQRLYERAVELWDQVSDPMSLAGLTRADLLDRTAEVAYLAGEPRRASALQSAALADNPMAPADPMASADPTVSADPIASADPTVSAALPSPALPPAALPPADPPVSAAEPPPSPLARAAARPAETSRDIQRAVRYERLGRYLWAAGDSRDALDAYQDAVACLPADATGAERATVEGAYAEALRRAGRYRDSRRLAEAALGHARADGDRLVEAQVLATEGVALAYLGDSASGVEALERAQLIAEELGRPEDIGRAYLNRVELLLGPLHRLDEAARIVERGIDRVRRLGLERTYGAALQAMAVNTMFRLGRWSDADRYLADALVARPTGAVAIELGLARAKLSIARGELAVGEELLRSVETMGAGGLGPRYEARRLTLWAALDLWGGQPEPAREAVRRGIIASVSGNDDIWMVSPLVWHGLRAEADLAEAARAWRAGTELDAALSLARGLAAQIDGLAQDCADAAPATAQTVDAYRHLCLGELARAEGRPDPDVWLAAAQRWLRLDQPYPAAYARWRESEACFATRTRSGRAHEALQIAHTIATHLGAAPLRASVEALARRARVDLAPDLAPPAADLDPELDSSGGPRAPITAAGGDLGPASARACQESYRLSAREVEVWQLLPEGLTNKQIGERLFISSKTASVHVTNLMRKLGCNSRVQAVTLAHQLGLLVGVEPVAPPSRR